MAAADDARKRKRPLERVERELSATYAAYAKLERERAEHPDYQRRLATAERARKRRRLEVGLPPRLLQELTSGEHFVPLVTFDVCDEVDELDDGTPIRTWTFRCTFEGDAGEYRCDIDRTSVFDHESDRFSDAFEPIVFTRSQPLHMWQVALDLNDDDPARALAAFCYACCEQVKDWNALPTAAFGEKN